MPWKATAGLHHPVRGEHGVAGGVVQHGFLNLFVAAVALHAGALDAGARRRGAGRARPARVRGRPAPRRLARRAGRGRGGRGGARARRLLRQLQLRRAGQRPARRSASSRDRPARLRPGQPAVGDRVARRRAPAAGGRVRGPRGRPRRAGRRASCSTRRRCAARATLNAFLGARPGGVARGARALAAPARRRARRAAEREAVRKPRAAARRRHDAPADRGRRLRRLLLLARARDQHRAASSGPTPSRCCPTTATCRSATTAAPARSSSAARRCAGRTASASRPARSAPTFGPSALLDVEVEMGWVAGPGNALGEPIPADAVREHVFGYVLLNDWSARDIQAWEYVPLGPFLGKSFATLDLALDRHARRARTVPRRRAARAIPSRCRTCARASRGRTTSSWSCCCRRPRMRERGEPPLTVSRTNPRAMYWTVAQQLAHATSNGATIRPGDLFGTGTISGAEPGTPGLVHRADLARRAPAGAARRRDARLPRGRRHGRSSAAARCAANAASASAKWSARSSAERRPGRRQVRRSPTGSPSAPTLRSSRPQAVSPKSARSLA